MIATQLKLSLHGELQHEQFYRSGEHVYIDEHAQMKELESMQTTICGCRHLPRLLQENSATQDCYH